MVKAGCPKQFGAGVITTSGALGILFPPSINLVIYPIATAGMNGVGPDGQPVGSASVGALLLAGIVPGLCLSALLGITTYYRAKKIDCLRLPKATWGERYRAFRESPWCLLLIVVVIGGIYSGKFTATEAAAMAGGLRLCDFGVYLQRPEIQRRAQVFVERGGDEFDAALHHHQRGVVQLLDNV
jgi:C4-dicarboxylate transporter, DctM subunit